MSNEILHDYIHIRELDIDLGKMKVESELAYQDIIKKFGHNNPKISSSTSKTTGLYQDYNLLLYPFPEFHKLYENIRKIFHEINQHEDCYYIQCWMNYYERGGFIYWHKHWARECNSWHGFYCVNTEKSSTTYSLEDGTFVDVESKNNNLVMSKSANDLHRTWPWEYDEPRITIAFDIVPYRHINYDYWTNHWIPI